MIGLLFALGFLAMVVTLWFHLVRWALATDRTPTQKRASLEAFLRDPLGYGKKGT